MGASMHAAMEAAPRVSVQRRPHTSAARVVSQSLYKFSPREQLRNPVMFVVYVFTWFVAAVTFFPWAFPDVAGPGFDQNYYLTVTIVLIATLWFANVAEAIAEAQAKAQADSLREARTGLKARQILPDGTRGWVPSARVHVGDRIEVRPNEVVAVDGDVVQGSAVIDESMMTGESEPVVRESGGDHTSVIGGSRVLQGTVVVRVTAEPGASFLDKMIQLVESTHREKSPNEVALTIILAALTMALLLVVVTFGYLLLGTGLGTFNLATLIALIVCLIPTTIGGLLSAVGISGVNRVSKANVVAKSGRAVEAAGDLDVLILDKTGTITVGNRLAVQFVPAPGETDQAVMHGALLASAFDETPEGRSVVRLAGLRGVQSEKIAADKVQVIPFSAERRASGLRLPDGTEAMKGSVAAMQALVGPLPVETLAAADDAARKGMTPLVITLGRKVLGIVILKDVVKPGIRDRLFDLETMGIRTVMCTGDNRLTAEAIARESGVDEYVAEARPESKLQLISREKQYGHLVAMTGDGTNDAPALARADVGLAMNSGTSAAKEAGNMVDLDSDPTKLIEIVSIGKQLLITRGALTTFSITNDVAKYFAIVPGLFIGLGGAASLNVLQLPNPETAVLATLVFNALMIPLLIPIALSGVSFRPMTAVDLLRRNLLIYGLGGLVSAFVGIKLLYLLFAYLQGLPAVLAFGGSVHHLLGAL